MVRNRVIVLTWIAIVGAVGYIFAFFDWGWGILRGAVLAVALALGLLLQRVRRPGAVVPPRWAARAGIAIACILLGYHIHVAFDWMATTQRAGVIKLDQGQSLYRALTSFPEVNPYGSDVLLDPVYYIVLVRHHYGSGCLRFESPPPGPLSSEAAREAWRRQMLARATRYWWYGDRQAARELMPEVSPSAACERARADFASLGFKYGPVSLAAFAPAVALLGKVGVFATQTLLFAAICALVVVVARQRAPGIAAAGAIALGVMLAVPLLRNNLLLTSALDGTATVLCLSGLALWLARAPTAAAVVLGLAVAAKLLPSFLYLPILFAAPRRAWLWCGACAVLPYVPFAVWDGEGLFNNIVRFPLTRGTNTTSLAHYLPDALRMLYTAFFGAVVLVAAYRMVRAACSPPAVMRYLLVAHLGLLAGSAILHNNYTIWFAPILALFTVELMTSDEAAVARSSHEPAGYAG